MKTIWKFTLRVADRQVIETPGDAEILSVQVQGATPCLWCLVDPAEPLRMRGIQIFSTGRPVEDAGVYIGTFQLQGGALVFHVFEDRDPREGGAA